MDRNHIIAWACGVFAALLVIMAGKSCMKIPEKKDKKTTTEATTLNEFELSLGTGSVDETKPKVMYDEFGRPIKITETEEEGTQTYTDENGNVIEPTTEIFTDEFGNVIEKATEVFTDEFGNVIEQPTEVFTDIFGNIIEMESQNVTDIFGNITEKNPPATALEEEESTDEVTEEPTKIPPGFSGFDHGKYDKDGNLIPTVPPDFKIVIE